MTSITLPKPQPQYSSFGMPLMINSSVFPSLDFIEGAKDNRDKLWNLLPRASRTNIAIETVDYIDELSDQPLNCTIKKGHKIALMGISAFRFWFAMYKARDFEGQFKLFQVKTPKLHKKILRMCSILFIPETPKFSTGRVCTILADTITVRNNRMKLALIEAGLPDIASALEEDCNYEVDVKNCPSIVRQKLLLARAIYYDYRVILMEQNEFYDSSIYACVFGNSFRDKTVLVSVNYLDGIFLFDKCMVFKSTGRMVEYDAAEKLFEEPSANLTKLISKMSLHNPEDPIVIMLQPNETFV